MSTLKQPTRREEFLREIDAALDASKYKDNKDLHRVYCIGLLKELLAYSAIDMMEVRERIRYLAQRQQDK